MGLNITESQVETIRRHGSREYPNECCGILLGHAIDGRKEVTDVVSLRNLRHEPDKAQELLPLKSPGAESERNRFLIDPRDQIRVEKDARARGLDVVGYYHSHPDHPAQPSNYDREYAWPWYSYVIIAVRDGNPAELSSWVLAEDRTSFEREPVQIVNPSRSAHIQSDRY